MKRVWMLLAAASLAAAQTRMALVIGNDAYANVPKLTRAVADSRLIALALPGAGFQVTALENTSREALDTGIDAWIARVPAGAEAFVYYAGHAVEIDGANYLLPVDLRAADAAQAKNRSLSVRELVERIAGRGAALQVLVLDACRNNPFPGRSIGGRGLAAMTAASRSFIAFSTSPGAEAADNGVYAQKLAAALGSPGLKVEDVFKRVSSEVHDADGRQVPWVTSNLTSDFYFRRPLVPTPPITPNTAGSLCQEAWQMVDRTRRDRLEAFIAAFPACEQVQLARFAMGGLSPATPSEPAVSLGSTKVNPKDGLTYVWIPAGSFRMGCSVGDVECAADEKPARQVTIAQGFWIGQTEVTQRAWGWIRTTLSTIAGSDLPVVSVNGVDARRFCAEAGMRLPTDAEWEYAARGGSGSARYGELDAIAWYDLNSNDTIHPVQQKRPNGYGLFDMLGNAWEWTYDSSGWVSRGAGYRADSSLVRLSKRHVQDPNDGFSGDGFRCAGGSL